MKRSKNQDRIERCKKIVEDATSESLAIIVAEEPEHETAISNFKAIHEICSKLVVADGLSTAPDYETIAAYGERMHGSGLFLAPQTIKNRYRKMVAIWRKAYEALDKTRSEREWTDFTKTATPRDTGPISAETILRETIRRLEVENHRLRAKLKQHSSGELLPRPEEAVGTGTPPDPAQFLDLSPARQWVSRIGDEASPLVATVAGLKLSKNARIGMIIMDASAYNVLKLL